MENIKKKPKSFWRYANSRLKTRILIPTLIKSDGTKTEELNNHFRGVFISEHTNTTPGGVFISEHTNTTPGVSLYQKILIQSLCQIIILMEKS